MPARTTTYTAQLDASQIRREAASLRTLFEGSLRNIRVDFLNGSDLRRSVGDLRAIHTEMDAITSSADRASQEARELADNIRKASDESSKARRGGGGADAGLGSLVKGAALGAAAYLGVNTIRGAVEAAGNLSDLAAQIRRTNVAFVELSGGEKEAAANLEAVKTASGGAITDLAAQQTALTALNLKLAGNATELKRVTEAARVVSVLSPVINDVQSALSELGLAAANLSFRRLDQLALSVDEVKSRMAALKAENSSLTDSQAFLNASVDALIAKGGAVVNSMEAQATGVEKLRAALGELREQFALLSSGPIDKAAEGISSLLQQINVGIGGGDAADIQQQLREAAGLQRIGAFGFQLGNEQYAKLADDAALALQQIADLEKRGISVNEEYKASIETLGRSILSSAGYTDENAAAVERAFSINEYYAQGVLGVARAHESTNESVGAADAVFESFADKVQRITDELVAADPSLANVASRMTETAIAAGAGAFDLDTYADSVRNVSAAMAELKGVQSGVERSIINQGTQLLDFLDPAKVKSVTEEALRASQEGFLALQARVQAGENITPLDYSIQSAQIQKESLDNINNLKQIEQDRVDAEREAQRERERADKQFVRDYESAAKAAAREMESTLKSVPGLFGTTSVTQEDFDLQKLGLRTDTADEFLRRLRAEVETGQDLFPDVSLEKAKAALDRIGANVGDGSAEAIVKALDTAWKDSSLFSDIQNIEELINPQAVQNAIDQAAKAKQGQQNLLDYFGLESPEDAGGAVAGVGTSIASTIKDEITAADVGGAVGEDIASNTQSAVADSLNLNLASVTLTPGFGADIAQQIANEFAAADVTGAADGIVSAIRDDFLNGTALDGARGLGTNLIATVIEGWFMTDYTQTDFAHPVIKAISDDFIASTELISLQTLGGFLSTVVTNGFMFRDLTDVDMAAPIYNKLNQDFILPDHTVTLQRLGEGMAGSVLFFFKPSEEADFAAPIMTKMQADFVSETVTTKLAGVGKSLAQRIHDEFVAETGRQEWAETVVDTIGSQMVNTVTDAVVGAAEGQ